MDALKLSLLRAELDAQLVKIDDVYALLQARASEMSGEAPATVDSAGYQLHNYYSAVEDLLELTARAFENNITDLSRWHSQLLDRMTLDIPGVRPPLLSGETHALLHRLRSFRHFFRHAYGAALDPVRVADNWSAARQVHALLRQDVRSFVEKLQSRAS